MPFRDDGLTRLILAAITVQLSLIEPMEARVPYYNLTDGDRTLSEPARDRADALRIFGEQIGKRLTLVEQDTVAPHLMDEWTEGAHWVHPTIPVWVIPDT